MVMERIINCFKSLTHKVQTITQIHAEYLSSGEFNHSLFEETIVSVKRLIESGIELGHLYSPELEHTCSNTIQNLLSAKMSQFSKIYPDKGFRFFVINSNYHQKKIAFERKIFIDSFEKVLAQISRTQAKDIGIKISDEQAYLKVEVKTQGVYEDFSTNNDLRNKLSFGFEKMNANIEVHQHSDHLTINLNFPYTILDDEED